MELMHAFGDKRMVRQCLAGQALTQGSLTGRMVRPGFCMPSDLFHLGVPALSTSCAAVWELSHRYAQIVSGACGPSAGQALY